MGESEGHRLEHTLLDHVWFRFQWRRCGIVWSTLLAVNRSVCLLRMLVDFCELCSCTYGMVGSDDNVVHVVWYACRVSSWSSSSSWIIWSRVIFLFSCLFLVLFFLKNVFTTCIFLFFFFFFWKSFLLPVFMLNCQIIADKDEDATRKYLDQVI